MTMKLRDRIDGIVARLARWGIKGVLEWMLKKMRMASNRRFIISSARRHSGQIPMRGVTIVGPLTQSWSMSKTLRDLLVRLRRCDIPFQTFDTGTKSPNVAKEDYQGLLTPRNEFSALKYSIVIELHYSTYPKGLGPKTGRLCFWEADVAFPEFSPDSSTSDFFVTMSDFNHKAIGEAYKQERFPVKKLLYPLLQVPSSNTSLDKVREKFGIGPNEFAVFSNFDFGSYHRKNPLGMVRAFAAAFRDEPKAKLIFKVNHLSSFPAESAEIDSCARELGIHDRLVIVSDYLPQNEIYDLTRACDVYLSLNRGEGFGLGIAEAMSIGKPVVITDFGAPLEFCTAANSMLVPFKRIPIKPGEYFMKVGTWPEPDISFAANCLRHLFEDPALRIELGQHAKATIEEHFSDNNFKKSVDDLIDFAQTNI